MWSNIIRGEPQEDGWDDEDSEDFDEEESEEPESEGTSLADQNDRPPPVGSLFMGRLTRFLDQVTQPEELENEQEGVGEQLGWTEGDTSLGLGADDGGGWDDEIEDLDLIEPDEENEHQNPHQHQHQHQSTHQQVDIVQQDQPVEPVDATDYQDADDGWGQDDDIPLDQEESPPPRNPPGDDTQPNIEVDDGWGDTAIDDIDASTSSQRAEHQFARAEAKLDSVLTTIDIDCQENDTVRHTSSDADGLADDAIHENQAVAEIQKELEQVSRVVDTLPQPLLDFQPEEIDPSVNVIGTDSRALSAEVDLGQQSDMYDEDNESNYGLVVNHIPKEKEVVPLERQTSMAVQPLQSDDFDDDDLDVGDAWDDPETSDNEVRVEASPIVAEPAVVDQTPSISATRSSLAGISDPSVGVLASESGTIAGDIEQDDGKDMDEKREFGPVVDHTPPTPGPPVPSGVNSLVVHAADIQNDFQEDDEMDETVSIGDAIDGGWDDDDLDLDDSDTVGEKGCVPAVQTTITFSDQDIVVDHTPSEILESHGGTSLVDTSVGALATTEDLTRCTENGQGEEGYGDVNEEAFGPVVDQTPLTSPEIISGEDSLAVNAQGGDDADEDFGDSFVAEDQFDGQGCDPVNSEDGTHLVDHTPAEMGSPSPKQNSTSVAVLASVQASGEVDDEEYSANNDYGPVVDQTPTTPMPTLRSDSVVVQAQDLDTVDGTLSAGSRESSPGSEEEEEVDDEMPGALRSMEDKLVDRVPQRPHSRFGDASTLVAAEPSELLSEVDDMAQEQNYGPVVDLTPNLGASSADLPSGAGSTVVFAPQSIAEDDLEVADETNGEDNGWDDTIMEEAPNPQSGNDEPVAQEEEEQQVVDFLPVRDNIVESDRAAASRNSDDSSEIAVGGAHSLALQTEDPKEDDFGPVVDLTPTISTLRASAVSVTSVATQVTASECRALEKDDNAEDGAEDTDSQKSKVVVDTLPSQMRSKLQVDSIATVGQSELTADEEEDNESSGYGPVVDQLPTSRASVAPSRGGSTVDALATVSEVDSDDEDGEGWDDDVDLDISVGGVSDRAPRQSIQKPLRQSLSTDNDRSVSVRFEAPLEKQPNEGSQTFETNSQALGWGGDVDLSGIDQQSVPFDKQLSEADTPPSTPYRRQREPIQRPATTFEGLGMPACLEPSIDKIPSEHSGENLASLRQRCAELEKENADAWNKLAETTARVTSMEKEKLSWQIKEKSLESQLESSAKDKQVQDGKATFEDEILAKVKAQEDTIASLHSKIGRETERNTSLASDLQKEKIRAQNAEKRLQDTEATRSLEVQNLVSESRRKTEAKSLLETQLAELTATVERQKVDIRLLQSTIDTLKEQSMSQSSMLSKQRTLADESESLANELVAVVEERDLLQESLADSKSAITSLQALVDEYGSKTDAKLSQNEAHVQSLLSDLAMAKDKQGELDRLVNDLNDQLTKENEEKQHLLHQLNESCVAREAQVIEIEQIKQFSSRSETALQEKDKELSNIVQGRDEIQLKYKESALLSEQLRVQVAASETEVQRLVADQEQSEVRLREMEAREAIANAAHEALQVENKQSEARALELESMLEELGRRYDDSKASFQAFLQQEKSAHEDELAQIEEECAGREQQLNAQVNSSREEISSLTDELYRYKDALEAKNDQTNGELNNLRSSISQANDFVERLQQQIEALTSERNSIASENDEVLVQLGLFHQSLQEKEEEISLLRDQLGSKAASYDDTSARNRDLESQNHEMCKQVKTISSRVAELEHQLRAGHQEGNGLDEPPGISDEQLVQLKSGLRKAEAELDMARNSHHEKDNESKRLALELSVALEALKEAKVHLDSRSQNGNIGRSVDQDTIALQLDRSEKMKEISSKDEIIAKLTCQIQERDVALTALQGERDDAKDEFLRAKQEAAGVKAVLSETTLLLAAKDEEITKLNPVFADPRDAPELPDNIDSLKSHVMTLAIALERSENRRAESIDRLLREREANAESLRRLSESVKRFYSAVSFGEG